VIPVSLLVAGIVGAAALDHRLGWGTVASVALGLYCHRLYRQPVSALPAVRPVELEEELRPGWAARWEAAEVRCGRSRYRRVRFDGGGSGGGHGKDTSPH
jgi:hypothetical protein